MKDFSSIIDLMQFKDPKKSEEFLIEVKDKIKSKLSEKDNWDLIVDSSSKHRITLEYELNKPKSLFGKISRLSGSDQSFKKNPNLKVKVSLILNDEKNKLWQNISIGEGGSDYINSLSKIGDLGVSKSLFGFNKKVNNYNDEINKTVNQLVTVIVDDFEQRRKEENKIVIKSLKSEIEPLIFNEEIRSLLNKNQNSFNEEHIPKLLKVIDYYNNNLTNYMSVFDLVEDKNFFEKHQSEISETVEMLPYMYNSVQLVENYILKMFQSQIEGDKITYFTIYNIFEELGIFLSKGEKIMIEKSENMISEIGKVNSSINDLIDTTIKVGEKISGQLDSINNNLKFNNLLTGIQTYQLSRINKKLR